MIYFYHDMDHDDIEVFDTLEKAKAYRNEQWNDEAEWEDNGDHIHDITSDYVSIYFKEI